MVHGENFITVHPEAFFTRTFCPDCAKEHYPEYFADQPATTVRVDNNQARIIRDQAYTHLKDAVDEIRACGQYVFWRDSQRYKGYVSQYYKRISRSRNTDKETETDPTTE